MLWQTLYIDYFFFLTCRKWWMDRIIIIKHPESSYSGNRITRTSEHRLERTADKLEDLKAEWGTAFGNECDDRLEVTSPGGLYNGLTYEEVMNGHSKIRNQGIANIFSQMGIVVMWGSLNILLSSWICRCLWKYAKRVWQYAKGAVFPENQERI